MWALKVAKEDAQREIVRLKYEGIFDRSRKVVRQGDHVIVPVLKKVPGSVEADLPPVNRLKSLKEEFGIGSYDVVGDIAIVFIPREKWDERFEIGAHLMKIHRGLRAVYAESGATSGEFRVKPLELVAGEGSETVHRENGIKLRLDVTRVYFSPRQVSERMKLVNYFKGAERVAVFFAGVGPIPIYLSKFAGVKEIYAVEKNPAACEYMRMNVNDNRCENVHVMCGDVRDLWKEIPPCDAVIMPLPRGSLGFLEEALGVLKEGGTAVIYVASKEEELESRLEKITRFFKVMEVRREKEIGPREYRFVVHCRK